MHKKGQLLKLQGVVKKILPGSKFEIQVDLGDRQHDLIGYISGKMRMYYIKLQVGDLVDLEVSPHDLTKGRIVFRHLPKRGRPVQKK